MSKFLSTPVLTLLAAGALAPAAFAQAPAPAAPPPAVPAAPSAPTAPATPAAPVLDPAAKTLFDQMGAACLALKSFSCTVESRTGDKIVANATIKFKRPSFAAVKTTAEGHVAADALSDGTNIYVMGPTGKTYQKTPAPPGQAILSVLSRGGSIIGMVAAAPQILQSLEGPPTQTMTLGPSETVGGLTLDTVDVTIGDGQGHGETIVFGIDPQSHLPRQITETMLTAPGATAPPPPAHTETVMALQADPTLLASDFKFTPPAGAKKMAAPAEPAMYDPRIKVGALPFPVKATDLDGKPLSLAAYHGKVVMLDFWATWCPPCRGEIPNVVAAYKKYHAQGFDIVGVSLDQPGDKAGLTTFLQQNGMTWPQIYDGGYWKAKVAQQYGVQAIPFSLIIGRDGRIAAVDARGPALDPAVQAALAKK